MGILSDPYLVADVFYVLTPDVFQLFVFLLLDVDMLLFDNARNLPHRLILRILFFPILFYYSFCRFVCLYCPFCLSLSSFLCMIVGSGCFMSPSVSIL